MSLNQERYTGQSAREYAEHSKQSDMQEIMNYIQDTYNMICRERGMYTIEQTRQIMDVSGIIDSMQNLESNRMTNLIQMEASEIERSLQNNPELKKEIFGIEKKKSFEFKMPKLSPRARSLMRRFSKSPAAFFMGALVITGSVGHIINEIKEKEYNRGSDTTTSTVDIVVPEGESSEDIKVPSIDDLQSNKDEIKYVLDFVNYQNPDLKTLTTEWVSSDKIGGFVFECGSGELDYPFGISNFQDPELEGSMLNCMEAWQLSGEMGNLVDLEKIIQIIRNNPQDGKTKPYGFYFYSTANTEQEADVEAEYISNFYKILQKRMQEKDPTYDINSNTFPFAIDIESNGEIKLGESSEERSMLREQRTDAMLHLVDRLIEKGVTTPEKGVTIYMDVNRVAERAYVDYNRLVGTIEEKGIRVSNWGTRALDQTWNNPTVHDTFDAIENSFLDDKKNLVWMQQEFIDNGTEKYTENLNMCQIHLNQKVTGPYGLDQNVDINITTANNIDWMLSENSRAIETPFLDQIQKIEDREMYGVYDENTHQYVKENVEEDEMEIE